MHARSGLALICFSLTVLSFSECSNARKGKSRSDLSNRGSSVLNGTVSRSEAPILIPGRSIGPIRLGMTRREAATIGLEVKPHPSGQMGDAVRLVGPYYVVFDDDRVASVAFTLTGSPTGLVFEGKTLAPTLSIDEVARALPNCGPVDVREGGTIIPCAGGTTVVKSALDGAVEVQVFEPDFPRP
jgi:hypothetical protein